LNGKEGSPVRVRKRALQETATSDLAAADRDFADRALPMTLSALSLRGLRDRLDELTGLFALADGDVRLGNDADEPAVLDNG
jgi:hypothetical protein